MTGGAIQDVGMRYRTALQPEKIFQLEPGTLPQHMIGEAIHNVGMLYRKAMGTISLQKNRAVRGGFEPPVPVSQHDGLANRWFQPLTHLTLNPNLYESGN